MVEVPITIACGNYDRTQAINQLVQVTPLEQVN